MYTRKSALFSAIYILLTAFIIAFFFPREGQFRYQFNEGKPWRYGLLTAPSDFPIYKEASIIEATKDSIHKRFEPYFRYNSDNEYVKKESWNYQKARLQNTDIPRQTLEYAEIGMREVYHAGIASTADLDRMRKENRMRINVLKNSFSEPANVDDLYTVKTAYEFIINHAPDEIDRNQLLECNINEYLTENLFYDAETSNKILDDHIQSISLSSGLVQAGERIVDRGEIVDEHIYSVLRSLKTVHETKSGGDQRQKIIIIGQFVLVFCIFICFGLYLVTFKPQLYYTRKNLLIKNARLIAGQRLFGICNAGLLLVGV
jgi:membrane-associated HD superfamily phosphohydrolase